jgi:hypothetical protein
MADIDSITNEQFNAAYNKFPANAWTKFIYKYFSKGTEQKNLMVSKNIGWLLAGLFVVGFIETALNLPHNLIIISTLIYFSVLAFLGIGMLGAKFMNESRINKIAKTLGVTIEEYDSLVVKFYS